MDATLMTDIPAPSVYRACSAEDWRAAAALLAEHRSWLRRAAGLDLAAAQPTARAEFDDLARFYRPPDGALVVARLGGRPVGLTGVHRLAGRVGELKRMYVTPAARGHGLGRALLVEAIAAAVDLGFVELRLQTKPDLMAVADRMYREHGFTDVDPYADLGLDGVATLALDLRRPAAGR
ncbi:MAG TPA: GNAT family N-acetyltransferase [Pseudonocardia sp.]|nr:GNAT family N-acetyltransferase [Pseudonocardia sp.]